MARNTVTLHVCHDGERFVVMTWLNDDGHSVATTSIPVHLAEHVADAIRNAAQEIEARLLGDLPAPL